MHGKSQCVNMLSEGSNGITVESSLSSGIEDATELDAGHNDASDEDLLALFAANQG